MQSKFHVVKVTVKTGCDLAKEMVKSNLPKAKATALRDSLESKNEAAEFDPNSLVSYLVEPAA
jgi:hypothetical protein